MEEFGSPRNIRLVLKNPAAHMQDFEIETDLSSTIRQLKSKLSKEYPTNPHPEQQKLIYAGKLLGDDQTLASIFSKANLSQQQKIHIITKSSAPPSPTPPPPQHPPPPQRHYIPFEQLPPNVQQEIQARIRFHQQQQQQQQVHHAHHDPPEEVENGRRRGGRDVLWLIMKLFFLVCILSKGGSISRVLTLSVLALLIYLYQTGLLHSASVSFDLNAGLQGGAGFLGQFILPFFYSLIPTWTPPESPEREAPPAPPAPEPEQAWVGPN